MTDAAYKVQEWLNRGYPLSLKLEAKKNHLLSMDSRGSGEYNEIQKNKADNNRQEVKEVEKSYLRQEIEAMQKELNIIDRSIDEALKHLNDGFQYQILYSRFVRRISWDKISEETDRSKSYLYQVRREALEFLAAHWKEEIPA